MDSCGPSGSSNRAQSVQTSKILRRYTLLKGAGKILICTSQRGIRARRRYAPAHNFRSVSTSTANFVCRLGLNKHDSCASYQPLSGNTNIPLSCAIE